MEKRRILLVEDDAFLASIYARKLEVEGFDVSLATSGDDGLKLVKKEAPDLILLDLVLPGVDGFEVLAQLKKEPTTRSIPVLILTNLGQREDVERCMSLGAAGYVIKAHSLPEETVAKVKEIWDNMPTFKYRVKAPDGSVQAGAVDAEDRDAAVKALTERGYEILLFEQQRAGEIDIGKSAFSFLNRIKVKDVVIASRNLSVMVSASVPIVDAVRNIATQSANANLRTVLVDVANEVEGGARFSDALERHGDVFGDFYVNMVRSGETSGQLTDVLEYLADQMEKDYDLNAKIKGAMIYPIFILSALFVVGFIMMTFVVPKLTQILEEAKVPLPWTTKALIFTSGIFQAYWWLIIILVIGAIFGFRAYIKTPGGRFQWDALKMKFPVFGGLFQRIYVVRFARSLSTLSKGGVGTVTALGIVAGVMSNAVWKQVVYETIREVNDGNSIITAIQRQKFVPTMMTQMLSVEEMVRLQEVLGRLSLFYAREIDNIVANMVALIEPLIMVILGLGVGVLVSAILLPLYNMSSAV